MHMVTCYFLGDFTQREGGPWHQFILFNLTVFFFSFFLLRQDLLVAQLVWNLNVDQAGLELTAYLYLPSAGIIGVSENPGLTLFLLRQDLTV